MATDGNAIPTARSDPVPVASVLTLVRNRQRHLDALIEGLTRQTCRDIELVIASMQPTPPIFPASPGFPVTVVQVPGDRLPLAAARNAAAQRARSDRLIFLDVDCIPSPPLVKSFTEQLNDSGRCLLGEVRYLPGTLPGQWVAKAAFNDLVEHAIQHPARPAITGEGWVNERDARSLWGLSFTLTRQQYWSVGGMDETYVGYGGEETDFAEKLAAAGVQLGWCSNAMALHQHHTVYTPPLDKFDDILANARRFYQKWGSWCMEYWLAFFSAHGYIEWSPRSPDLRVIRHPSEDEIEACRQPPEVAFA